MGEQISEYKRNDNHMSMTPVSDIPVKPFPTDRDGPNYQLTKQRDGATVRMSELLASDA